VTARGALRLGLALGGARDPAGWQARLALAERAEALGLHSLWLPEGHFTPGATASPLVGLGAFAGRTARLRLCTTSLLLPLHDPLALAAQVAALDALSGGRVWLGLGRGFRSPVLAGFGVAAAAKRDRFDRALDAMLRAWGDGPGPRPLQRPHPPLLVAAFGHKGLVQAARRGLPYLASPLESLAVLEQNYALHRDHLASERLAGECAVPVMRTVFVAESEAQARRALAGLEGELAALSGRAPGALARAASGAPGERLVVGSAAFVAEALARYRERLGMDLLIARVHVPGLGEAAARDALERLATEVMPRLA
jgi:alkanesulfonate monooxygenase SsuD/methylene tetrahydromethanopterin reductase-like flavin-dependent oxidoreductase (luciferase family)